MMRTTVVPPLTGDTARDAHRKPVQSPGPAQDSAPPTAGEVILVGLDFGTNTSCLKVMTAAGHPITSETLPTVVGYAKEGVVENLLPGNAKVLFGQAAVKNRMYLRMVAPMAEGVIADMPAAHDFVRHLRGLIQVPAGSELRAVVGIPAAADRTAREDLCRALDGFFDRVILIPEPFLGALGFRDEAKLADPSYVDPVRNSIFVDIGAGTTDVCLVQGYFPGGDDEVSVAFAGDRVDVLLQEGIRRAYPDVVLSLARVRDIKERFSYVGAPETAVQVNVVIGGKARQLELTEVMGQACQQLLVKALDCVKAIIGQASTDTVTEVLQNIVLTGGGSRIRNFDRELQRLLTEEGYEQPRVLSVGEQHKELVARGALVAGGQARESQWIALT